MIHHAEDDLIFGTDEEFHRRVNEAYSSCQEQIRWIIRMILNSPGSCWSFMKSLPGWIKDKFIKQYIAMTVLFISVILLFVLGPLFGGIPIVYCLTFAFCASVSIGLKRGFVLYGEEYSVVAEQKRLLDECSRPNRQEAVQPAGNGARNEKRLSQRDLESMMEPRPENRAVFPARKKYQVPHDSHHSDLLTPIGYYESSTGPSQTPNQFSPMIYGADSEGPSSAPDPFPALNYNTSAEGYRTFAKESRTSDRSSSCTSTSTDVTPGGLFEETYDSNEPTNCLSQARLALDGVRAFGLPVSVLGADSYGIFLSSDEYYNAEESSPATFQVSVEVHPDTCRSTNSSIDGSSSAEPTSVAIDDSRKPINSNNDGSSFAERTSMASDETTRTTESDLHSNIPYVDEDRSSETTCSTHVDEESTGTED